MRRTKPNLRCATFARRLAKITQTAAQTRAPGNSSVVAMATPSTPVCCYNLLLAKPKNRSRCYIFAYFSQPQHQPQTWLYSQNVNEPSISTTVHTKILSVFHTRIEYISVKNTPFKQIGETPQTTLPLSHVHPSLTRPNSPPQTASSSNQPFCHNALSRPTDRQIDGIGESSVPRALMLYCTDRERHAKTSPQSNLRRAALQRPHWLQWDAPNSPPNCPFSFDDHHPHLIRPSFDRLHSPPQTASGSNQPFCHNTLSGPTDQPTDGIGESSVPRALTLYCVDRERHAKKFDMSWCSRYICAWLCGC